MAIAKTNPNQLNSNVVSQISELTNNSTNIKTLNVSYRQYDRFPDDIPNEPYKKKLEYDDNFNLRLPTGERNRLKSFCAERGVSMTQFILFSIEYLQESILEGRCSVSKMGIRNLQS